MAKGNNGNGSGALKSVRCAIYTRKSTDEGLNQDFNSLDAQRESGEAYIRSQAGEGWVLLQDRYDDGGYIRTPVNGVSQFNGDRSQEVALPETEATAVRRHKSIGLRNQRVPVPGAWLLNEVERLPKPCGRGGITMLRVVRYLVILLLDVVPATHNPRRIRFACTNEPTPRPATTRNCRVWSHRKRTFLLLLAAPDSKRESMLECGNQKQPKQLGFKRIWDPYSIGTEKVQNILQVAENKSWLPGMGSNHD